MRPVTLVQVQPAGTMEIDHVAIKLFTQSLISVADPLPSSAQPVGEFELGVNFSGMETFNSAQGVPSVAEMQYHVNRGLNWFRIPMNWLYLQPTIYGALNATYLSFIAQMLANAAAVGAEVTPDIHNFGSHGSFDQKIGNQVPLDALPDLWLKLSHWFRAQPNFNVIRSYDFMNEWAGMDPAGDPLNNGGSTPYTRALILDQNARILQALRSDGDNTFCWLEYDHFSGAWDAVANGIEALFDLAKADGNAGVEVHSYLDSDSSGTNFVYAVEAAKPGYAPPGTPTSPTIGPTRMAAVTAMARQKGVRLWLGEYGWSADQLTEGGNDDYTSWNIAATNMMEFCRQNKIAVTPWGGGFPTNYGYNWEPSNVANQSLKDFTPAGLQSTHMVVFDKYTGYNGPQARAYRADLPFGVDPYTPPGTPLNNFKIRHNALISATEHFTGHANLSDGTDVGGTFSDIAIPPGDNGIATFSYTPAGSYAGISLTFTNDSGLIDPPAIGISSATDIYRSLGISPDNVYALRRRVASYIGPAIRLQRVDGHQQDFYFNVLGNLPRLAIQQWAGASDISIITIYDQTANRRHISVVLNDQGAPAGGAYAYLTLNNAAGYPEITFPANAFYSFTCVVNGNLEQSIVARISDTNSGSFFMSMDNADQIGTYYPFRWAPSGYNVNNNSVSIALGLQTGVYHTYATAFKADTVNGLKSYKDGTLVSQTTTPAGAIVSPPSGATMGYFNFYHASQWRGSWTNADIFDVSLNGSINAALAADDASYYSTPLPDSLPLVSIVLTGAIPNQEIYPGYVAARPFVYMTVIDGNSGTPTDSVVITATGAAGTLSGAGISGSGPYTIAAASAASVTATLRGAVWTTAAGVGSTTTFSIAITSSAGPSEVNNNTSTIVAAYNAETAFASPGTFTPISGRAAGRGVNLSGGENTSVSSPSLLPQNFQIDYFASKGFGIIRIPITSQYAATTAFGLLNATYMAALKSVCDYAFTKNMYVMIDVHDFGSVWDSRTSTKPVILPNTPAEDLHLDQLRRLATLFKNYGNVRLDTQNEPVGMTAAQWRTTMDKAMPIIRGAGFTQKVYVEGGGNFAGAHNWVSAGNAAAFTGFNAANPNIIFEAHQYLDSNNDGYSNPVAVVGKGATVLAPMTAWLASEGAVACLGEFGIAPDPWYPQSGNIMGYDPAHATTLVTHSISENSDMLAYMNAHVAQWPEWTVWSAGRNFSAMPSSGGYAFNPEPPRTGGAYTTPIVDQPQMVVLQAYL